MTANSQPNAGQKAMVQRGYGMFIHFGINTFNQAEWSDGTLPISSYNPTQLDCDQWIRLAKEAGFRHVVLVTKHHDGFCLWPTQYTDYSVSNSPVPTDVVAEVATSCQKYGLKFGLYYSLWDRHEPTHQQENATYYVEFMKKQLTELLSNYGEVCEIWFDGGWAKPNQDWDIPAIYAHIKSLQPDCQVTVNHTIHIPGEPTQIRQPGDYVEGDPIRYWPVDFRTKDPNIARWDDPSLYTTPDGELVYLPFEHTICLSDRWNWFQKQEDVPTRSLDELEELFYWGTKNDHVLIVNLPPDQSGRLRTNEVETILALADRLNIRGGEKPLPAPPINQAFNVPIEASSTSTEQCGLEAERAVDTNLESRWAAQEDLADLTLSPYKAFVFDRISLHEYGTVQELGDGFSQTRLFNIREFYLDVWHDNDWKTIHSGTTIGAAKVLHFSEKITTDKVRLRITQASGPPSLYHFSVSDTAMLR
jgi:alpha-L-fucosidase